MQTFIIKAVQDRIIFLWILGIPREQIEDEAKVSHGTVHNVVVYYAKMDPLIPLLRQIAVAARHAGIDIAHFAFNTRIIQALNRSGFETDWIESFLGRIGEEYISTGRPVEEVVTTINEIAEFMALRHVSIHEAFELLKQLIQSIAEMERRLHKIQKENQDSNLMLQQVLSKNKISMQKVDLFVSQRTQLIEFGFTIGDYSKTLNVLQKLSEKGYKVKQVAEVLEANFSLEEQREKLVEDCRNVANTTRFLSEKLEITNQWWGTYDEVIKDWINLKAERKLSADQIAAVIKLLNDCYPETTPQELCEQITKYHNLKLAALGQFGNYPF